MPRAGWLLFTLVLVACATTRPPPNEETPKWEIASLTAGQEAKNVKAVLAPGYAAVAWEEGTPTRLYLAERSDAGWSEPALIAGGDGDPAMDYDLAANARGDAVLAWREGGHVRVRVRKDGTWQSTVELAQSYPMRIAVAMGGDGVPWVAWKEKIGSYDRILVARDPGGGFQTQAVSPDRTNARAPDLAALPGEALVAWQARSDIGYASFRDGAWQPPGSFRGSFSNTDPRVALTPERALLIWERSDPGGSRLLHVLREEGTWSAVSRLGPPEAANPAAAAAGEGFLVAWDQPDLGGRAVVARSRRGPAWGRGVYLSLPGTKACCPAAALTGERALVAWWQEDAGGKGRLYLAEFSDEGWRLPHGFAEALSPEAGEVDEASPTAALLEDGTALVVWVQEDEGGVKRVWVGERGEAP